MMVRFSILVALLYTLSLHSLVAQELKFLTPSVAKVHEGAAPVVASTYEIYFKKKKNQSLTIDSIKSISDEKKLDFFVAKKRSSKEYKRTEANKISPEEKGNFRLYFNTITLLGDELPPAYSEENKPIQYDMSKGVRIYLTLSGKKQTAVIKSFKETKTVMP